MMLKRCSAIDYNFGHKSKFWKIQLSSLVIRLFCNSIQSLILPNLGYRVTNKKTELKKK